jgi:hypothetical protein
MYIAANIRFLITMFKGGVGNIFFPLAGELSHLTHTLFTAFRSSRSSAKFREPVGSD